MKAQWNCLMSRARQRIGNNDDVDSLFPYPMDLESQQPRSPSACSSSGTPTPVEIHKGHFVWGATTPTRSGSSSGSLREARVVDRRGTRASRADEAASPDQRFMHSTLQDERSSQRALIDERYEQPSPTHRSDTTDVNTGACFLDDVHPPRPVGRIEPQVPQQIPTYREVPDELLKQVPYDEDGNQTSIGSIGHYENKCERPCTFVHLEFGCRNGVRCEFCHFPHDKAKKKRNQPCKAQRNRYRMHQERLLAELERAPHTFDVDRVELPECICSNENIRRKTIKMLHERLHDVLRSEKDRMPA